MIRIAISFSPESHLREVTQEYETENTLITGCKVQGQEYSLKLLLKLAKTTFAKAISFNKIKSL